MLKPKKTLKNLKKFFKNLGFSSPVPYRLVTRKNLEKSKLVSVFSRAQVSGVPVFR